MKDEISICYFEIPKLTKIYEMNEDFMDYKPICLCDTPFDYVATISPTMDESDNLFEHSPQSRYNNVKNLPYNKNGDGTFCKFKININPKSGVYLWVVGNSIIYVGEAYNLNKRFNIGYGNISPRNCFKDGQSTNCKMNKVVKEHFEKKEHIRIYVHYTEKYKQLEKKILLEHQTLHNERRGKSLEEPSGLPIVLCK